jgi:hypothetical protein
VFNKATSLHDVLYKRRKPILTDYRKAGDVISVLFRVQRGVNNVNALANGKIRSRQSCSNLYRVG